ncbi:MAG: hypothetical protein FVQ80_13955 [Planctomycetes bacterium]|nr:hypothetical protein [Planctomycetota bacterium]
MVTAQMEKDFQKSIDELEKAFADPPKPQRSKTQPRYTQEEKEAILEKATEAGQKGLIDLKDAIKLEGRLQKGLPIPEDWLRFIGYGSLSKAIHDESITRREALAELSSALDSKEITFRNFTVAEDRLNKGLETPTSLLKSLRASRSKRSCEVLLKSKLGGFTKHQILDELSKAYEKNQIEYTDMAKAEELMNKQKATPDEISERLQEHLKQTPDMFHKRENRSMFSR